MPISVIFDNHYFYCISYKLDNCFQSRYELQELRYFRVDRFKTIHKSISNSAFALTEEEQERLITDEQVRYQTFSMLSDQKWVRIQFRYTGQFRDVLEADIPKLKMINELEEGIIYEIETLSLLGFQKYIQRFDGDFVFLNIKSIKK